MGARRSRYQMTRTMCNPKYPIPGLVPRGEKEASPKYPIPGLVPRGEKAGGQRGAPTHHRRLEFTVLWRCGRPKLQRGWSPRNPSRACPGGLPLQGPTCTNRRARDAITAAAPWRVQPCGSGGEKITDVRGPQWNSSLTGHLELNEVHEASCSQVALWFPRGLYAVASHLVGGRIGWWDRPLHRASWGGMD